MCVCVYVCVCNKVKVNHEVILILIPFIEYKYLYNKIIIFKLT